MRNTLLRFFFGAAACVLASQVHAQEPARKPTLLTPDRFDSIQRLIRPQPGELRFNDIPWLLDIHEARKKAAAEGKPLLIWSGSGGAPLGVC